MSLSYDIELDPADTAGRGGVGRWRAICVFAATAGALLIWVVADPVAGVDVTVGSGSSARAVGPGAVTLVSLIVGLAAVGLAVLLARATPSLAKRIWRIVAVVTLVVSLAGPLGAASVGAGVALAVMHLVVGATLIVGIGRTVEDPARSRA